MLFQRLLKILKNTILRRESRKNGYPLSPAILNSKIIEAGLILFSKINKDLALR